MTIIATTPAISCIHRLPTIGPYTTFGSKLSACSIVCASSSRVSGQLFGRNGGGYRYGPRNLLDLFIDERLHFGDVFGLEMGKPALRFHVVADRFVLLRHVGVFIDAVFPLVHRPHSRLDGQLRHVRGHLLVEEPALWAGAEDVEESGSRLAQRFPDFIHQVERMGDRAGGYVFYRGVAADDQLRGVFGEERVALWNLFTGRRESGRGAIRRHRRYLDARVCIRLVVVADEENFVTAV